MEVLRALKDDGEARRAVHAGRLDGRTRVLSVIADDLDGLSRITPVSACGGWKGQGGGNSARGKSNPYPHRTFQ